MRCTRWINGVLAAATAVLALPTGLAAHPGHGIAAPLHLHPWEAGLLGVVLLLVAGSLGWSWLRSRD